MVGSGQVPLAGNSFFLSQRKSGILTVLILQLYQKNEFRAQVFYFKFYYVIIYGQIQRWFALFLTGVVLFPAAFYMAVTQLRGAAGDAFWMVVNFYKWVLSIMQEGALLC